VRGLRTRDAPTVAVEARRYPHVSVPHERLHADACSAAAQAPSMPGKGSLSATAVPVVPQSEQETP
jgi:hypothetical protein